jgi:hypothetical protein
MAEYPGKLAWRKGRMKKGEQKNKVLELSAG